MYASCCVVWPPVCADKDGEGGDGQAEEELLTNGSGG